ncbi:Bifunctional polynucleotide phosphatase/kinase [Durusdinium trenchii]|uniref:Bifunctional polynucleotide phosphatase/kinase n=1 Tax=Durusdinium trenchii TaxID=1381693 RepID=A0ABP0R1U7_9DINO
MAFSRAVLRVPGAPGLSVRRSSLHGLGVFVEQRFVQGQTIETCPCLWVAKTSLGETVSPSGTPSTVELLDYLYAPGRRGAETQDRLLLPLGFGLSYNHGENCNATYKVYLEDPPLLVFRALRDLAVGEEVLIDYGEDWWRNRGWRPLSPGFAVFRRSSVGRDKKGSSGAESDLARKARTNRPIRGASRTMVILLQSLGFPEASCRKALEAERRHWKALNGFFFASKGDPDAAANQLLAERLTDGNLEEFLEEVADEPWSFSEKVQEARAPGDDVDIQEVKKHHRRFSVKSCQWHGWLQVGGFFVVVPQTDEAEFFQAHGGVIDGLPLRRKSVIAFHPQMLFEEGEELDHSPGWERLEDSVNVFRGVALELECEHRLGIWLFAGKYWARIISGSSLVVEARPKNFEALAGEVRQPGQLMRAGPNADLFFDHTTANAELKDGIFQQTLPSGEIERWKVHVMTFNPFVRVEPVKVEAPGPAGPSTGASTSAVKTSTPFVEGTAVKYWSVTVQRWVPATIVKQNEDGTYRLDLKKRANPQHLILPEANEGSRMPADGIFSGKHHHLPTESDARKMHRRWAAASCAVAPLPSDPTGRSELQEQGLLDDCQSVLGARRTTRAPARVATTESSTDDSDSSSEEAGENGRRVLDLALDEETAPQTEGPWSMDPTGYRRPKRSEDSSSGSSSTETSSASSESLKKSKGKRVQKDQKKTKEPKKKKAPKKE